MDDTGGWETSELERIGIEIHNWCDDENHRVTRERLADILGLHPHTITKIWQGKKALRSPEITILANLMGKEEAFFVPRRPPTDERFPHGVCQSGQKPADPKKEQIAGQQARGDPEIEARRERLLKLCDEIKANLETLDNLDKMEAIEPMMEGMVKSSR